MNYIYIIKCKTADDCYVGSTCNFNNRMTSHKGRCNNIYNSKHNLKLYVGIRDLGGWDNFDKSIITETDETGYDLLKLERYYIDEFNANLNTQLPTNTKQQSNKNWEDKNKEYTKQKGKERTICNICGCDVMKKTIKRHQRGKKCLSFV